ncbi:MAG: hypothetical protein H0U52_05255 [Chloroflexi bacterium]|nr:hypothetical protein [Chloroflexota bacterium]
MTDDLERRLRESLSDLLLPSAPRALHDAMDRLEAEAGAHSRLARSVAARPRRRAPMLAGRWAFFGSIAGAVTIGLVLVSNLGGRPTPSPLALSSVSSVVGSPSPTAPSDTRQPTTPITGCASISASERRCRAILGWALLQSGGADAVASVSVHPPPTRPPGVLGGIGPSVVVVVTAIDGTETTLGFLCLTFDGALPSDLKCSEDAQIPVVTALDHDVPCGAQPGGATHPCATLPPKPRAQSVADSDPLRVASLDVPLDHLGHYEVFLGDASLPDGVLTERSARLVDPSPETFWIEGGVSILLRPTTPGRPPILSVYRDPFDGPEPVKVYLVFDLSVLDRAAVLQIRDIVVR